LFIDKKMKEIMIIMGALFALMIHGVAQEVPKRAYVAQPCGDTTNGVTGISVMWHGTNNADGVSESFLAYFDAEGEVTSMSYWSSSPDDGETLTQTHKDFPAKKKGEGFEEGEEWRKFAKGVRNGFVILDDDVYAEKDPFILIARSLVISNYERPDNVQSLIFRKSNPESGRHLSVTLDRWIGKIPNIGESVVIGQTSRADRFFPTEVSKTTPGAGANLSYRLSEEVVTNLASYLAYFNAKKEEEWKELMELFRTE